MRYALEANDSANAGLDKARNMLEPLKAKYPGVSFLLGLLSFQFPLCLR